MTNPQKKLIKIETREEFRKYCNTDNFSAPPYETEIISDWWLSKIDELLKSQRDSLVERIEKVMPSHDAVQRELSLIKQDNI